MTPRSDITPPIDAKNLCRDEQQLRYCLNMTSPLPPIIYEEISLDYIRQLIGADARVVIEIGAHHGWHTAAFLKAFSNATIYAFEPDPRAIERFSANVSSPRVHLFKMAVGATDGEAQFHVSSGLPPGIDPAGAAAVYPRGWDQCEPLKLIRKGGHGASLNRSLRSPCAVLTIGREKTASARSISYGLTRRVQKAILSPAAKQR
jgi:hypothetical protein